MFAILTQLFFFLGLAIIIWLVVRKTPKIVENLELNVDNSFEAQIESHIGKTFFKIPWDKIDAAFEKLIEKMMRRLHIWTLKIDALLQKKLESFKNKNKEKPSFVAEVNNHEEKEEAPQIVDLSQIDLEKIEKPEEILNNNENKNEDIIITEEIETLLPEETTEENEERKLENFEKEEKENDKNQRRSRRKSAI
jgi:hypothetical protein